MKVDKPVHIGKAKLGNRLMNGAYIHSKTLEDVQDLAKSECGAIVVGSISVHARKKNYGQGYWRHKEKFYSLNSYGMPNGGIAYFRDNLPRMADIAHSVNKPLIANVVGFSTEEFIELIKLAESSGADIVELNMSCPNVWDSKGKQKQILSYHPSLIEATLSKIKSKKPTIPIALKLSPLPPDILAEVSRVIVKSNIAKIVTATNSYPNSLTSTGTKIKNESTLAGLSGRALKPISLGMVKQLRELLPSHIEIIGCGGISSANDVIDFIKAGAKSVQIATALMDEGKSVFSKILFQASEL